MRTLVGTSMTRTEDARLLTGTGRFLDDVSLPRMLHAAFVRSMLPHARIDGIDVDAAREQPGVIAVLTGRDLAEAGVRPLQLHPVPDGYGAPSFPVLAIEKVRLVGDPLAVVIAESRAQAESAAELVMVDYDPLGAVDDVHEALQGDSPVVFEELGSNLIYESVRRDHGDVDAAFASADHVAARSTTIASRTCRSSQAESSPTMTPAATR
jgi:carbon-monoxide dehydrogenase large subunit